MKAAVFHTYGAPEVLKIEEVTKPTPSKDEILVKVVASSVNSGDVRIRGARFPKGFGFVGKLMFGIPNPRNKILGISFSGIVEQIREAVVDFKVGDEVFGMSAKMQAHAEYLTIKANKSVVLKPADVTHEQAAAVSFGGTTALYFLRDKAKVQRDQRVLINGASGAVGTNAIQLAKYFGAHVTAVTSAKNIELMKSLGADEVVDYTKQDIFELSDKFDLVIDTVGNIDIEHGMKLIKPEGKVALIVAGLGEMFTMNKRVLTGTATETNESLTFLGELVSQGKLQVVIDAVYPLEQVVEAHRHVDSGHKRGNVVLKIG